MFYKRPNLLFLACRLSLDILLNKQKMLAFSFCFLLEVMEPGKWFSCSQPWLLGIFQSQKHCFLEHSRQVKVFVFRIFGIIVRNVHKLVRAFLFRLSNHSIWSIRFSVETECVREALAYDVEVCTLPVTHVYTWKWKHVRFLHELKVLWWARVSRVQPRKTRWGQGGVSFNLVPRSHSGRGRSGYEIRGRLKRAL